ncbi:hypothetical protein [Agromyces sp. NPDC056965]|uniref:hypothetical protein n=1 Tax=Agromyces sp. NPDC056965 TaxID=3345983 RepID=UPI00363296E5
MSAASNPSWSEDRPDSSLTPEEQTAEGRLELLDRVIGLEQQLQELQAANLLTPTEAVAVERNLASMRSSLTWRAGRVVTLPVRVVRYVKRRVLG